MNMTRAEQEVERPSIEQNLAKEALNRGICSGIIAACTRIKAQKKKGKKNKQKPKKIERSQIEQITNIAQTINKNNYEIKVQGLILYALRQAARGQITMELAVSIKDNMYTLLRDKEKYSDEYIAHVLREYMTALKWTYEIITRTEKTEEICKQLLQPIRELCNSNKISEIFDTFIEKLDAYM